MMNLKSITGPVNQILITYTFLLFGGTENFSFHQNHRDSRIQLSLLTNQCKYRMQQSTVFLCDILHPHITTGYEIHNSQFQP